MTYHALARLMLRYGVSEKEGRSILSAMETAAAKKKVRPIKWRKRNGMSYGMYRWMVAEIPSIFIYQPAHGRVITVYPEYE